MIHKSPDIPERHTSILAEISHVNSLGTSKWYEVVYFHKERCSFAGSRTFDNGEIVTRWIYIEDIWK